MVGKPPPPPKQHYVRGLVREEYSLLGCAAVWRL
jgi:hypothetical protein